MGNNTSTEDNAIQLNITDNKIDNGSGIDSSSFNKKLIIKNLEILLSANIKNRQTNINKDTTNTNKTVINKNTNIKQESNTVSQQITPNITKNVDYEKQYMSISVKNELLKEIERIYSERNQIKSQNQMQNQNQNQNQNQIQIKQKRVKIDQTNLLQELLRIEKENSKKIIEDLQEKISSDEKTNKITIGLLRNIIEQKECEIASLKEDKMKLMQEKKDAEESCNKWRGFYYEAVDSVLNPTHLESQSVLDTDYLFLDVEDVEYTEDNTEDNTDNTEDNTEDNTDNTEDNTEDNTDKIENNFVEFDYGFTQQHTMRYKNSFFVGGSTASENLLDYYLPNPNNIVVHTRTPNDFDYVLNYVGQDPRFSTYIVGYYD